MNETIAQLLKLQQMDLAIRKHGHDLQQLPKRSREIDEKIRDVKAPYDTAVAEIVEIEGRGAGEVGLRALEEKERQLKMKMPGIRTNEEYSALLKEMDATKKEKEQFEDRSIHDLDRLEELKKAMPDLEEALRKGEEAVAEERAAVQAEKACLEKELLRAKKDRQALQTEMHQGWFRKYNTIAAQRNGLAVVSVKGGTCQGCFTSLRPKVVQDLHYGEEVLFCEGCQRVLYLDDAAARS